MAPVKLYVYPTSPPCRAVTMACQAAGINLEYHPVDIYDKQQYTQEFLRMNPNHTVPTMDDGGFYLCESRSIATYLLDKYAPDHQLWPKDLQKRATIRGMMDYDLWMVYENVKGYVFPIFFEKKEPNPEKMEKMLSHLNDGVFHNKKYAAGDELTLADICMVASLTLMEIVGYSPSAEAFPNVAAWVQRVKAEAFYDPANVEYEKAKKGLGL